MFKETVYGRVSSWNFVAFFARRRKSFFVWFRSCQNSRTKWASLNRVRFKSSRWRWFEVATYWNKTKFLEFYNCQSEKSMIGFQDWKNAEPSSDSIISQSHAFIVNWFWQVIGHSLKYSNADGLHHHTAPELRQRLFQEERTFLHICSLSSRAAFLLRNIYCTLCPDSSKIVDVVLVLSSSVFVNSALSNFWKHLSLNSSWKRFRLVQHLGCFATYIFYIPPLF